MARAPVVSPSVYRVGRYVFAAVAVAVFLALRWLIQPWLGPTVPYLLFFPAIMLSAWAAGAGPGVLATALSAAAAVYFFLAPDYSFALRNTTDVVSLVLFIAVGCAISGLTGLLRRAEQAHRAAADAAVNANRLKDDFLATLSHELRTPLSAILGYTRMLRSGMVDAASQHQALETIERNGSALARLIADVLDVSRIVQGKVQLSIQSVDLVALAREAIATARPAADGKGIRLHAMLDDDAGSITGDRDRLQQILWNLLSNAVRFTPRGGRVQVRLQRVDSSVEFAVSDTGIGISTAFLPHVFERFRQAEAGTAREQGGLGLGLAIAKELAEMHGGRLRAYSDGEGKGATFTLTLPLAIVADARPGERREPPTAGEAARPVTHSEALRAVRVLVVDDDPDSLTLVRGVLENAGATVVAASGAPEALAVLRQRPVDVMVTDLGMPVMDGFALLTAVRSATSPVVRAVPVAALSAYARSEDRTRSLRHGFQMHLAKPIHPEELVAAVSVLAKTSTVH